MKILALEFSSPQRSVAVVDDGQAPALAEVIETGGRGANALGMVEAALRQARLEQLAGGDGFHVEPHAGHGLIDFHFRRQGAKNLVGDPVRLKSDAGVNAEPGGVRVSVA